MPNLTELNDEESELLAKLEAIRRTRTTLLAEENDKKAEEARNKPLEIIVTSYKNEQVEIENKYREDVITLLREISGRSYHGNGTNYIPIASWQDFLAKVSALNNITITYRAQIEEKINKVVNAPSWEILLYPRSLHVIPGRAAKRSTLRYDMPEAIWNQQSSFYEIPLALGWRLVSILGDTGVVWAPDALVFVEKQLEQRAILEGIHAIVEDNEYAAFDMNGLKLRPFQTVGCRFFEATGGRAICADEMGLGKTWQDIAYIEKNNFRSLIIVPASLKRNWEREIFKLTGKKPLILSGITPTKEQVIQLLVEKAQYTIINYDILSRGTPAENNTTRYLWTEFLNLAKFDLISLDEAHYIKNTDSNRSRAILQLQAPHITMLTGTPIDNRVGELWPMLHMLAPEQFPNFDTFVRQFTIDGKRPKNTAQLREILKSFMIRRLKKDVMKDLPAVNRITVYPEISPKAYKLYNKILAGIYETLAEFKPGSAGEKQAVPNILVQIMRLKQVCAISTIDETAELAQRLYDQSDETTNRKILIFSQFKSVAYNIYQRLADDGAICFVGRHGNEFQTANADERDKLVLEFQNNPDIKYLVVTEKTTKEGHNITAAGHVVFNDLFWTPTGHDQAIGRAYGRLNDAHGVDAYFQIVQLPQTPEGINQESISDWIWEVLGFKQGLINTTVEGLGEARDISMVMALIGKLRELRGV